MSPSSRYNLIIIGTGPDSGTLVYTVAPSEKKCLLLVRGGYLPREKNNEIRQPNESCQCQQVCLNDRAPTGQDHRLKRAQKNGIARIW